MKNVYALTLIALLFGCTQKEAKINTEPARSSSIDSLISRSEKTSQDLGEINKKSDSVITQKVEGAVKKIEKLETENKALRNENKQLKAIIYDNDDSGQPYRIRTISDN